MMDKNFLALFLGIILFFCLAIFIDEKFAKKYLYEKYGYMSLSDKLNEKNNSSLSNIKDKTENINDEK